MNRWYTIQILPNQEKTADWNLRRQSFEPFFPKIAIRRDPITTIIEPLFKGYGFVKIDLEVQQWRSINGTLGVIGLLPRHSLLPSPMADGFIEYFIDLGPVQVQEFEETVDRFYPGLIVEIKNGILKGRSGEIVNVRHKLLEIILISNNQVKNYHTVLVDKKYVG